VRLRTTEMVRKRTLQISTTKKRAGLKPAPTLSFFAYFAFSAAKSFSLLSRTAYLNSGSTLSANKRIFFIAISCGMPPK
jgi:hypothetical protein